MIPFLLLIAGMAAWMYLHFVLAHRELRRGRGRTASEIDIGYVRLEDYFGQSFRTKLRDWVGTEAASGGARVIAKGPETIRVLDAADFPAGSECPDILVVEGEFRCGPDCTFHREIYVKGSCRVGSRSRLQAIAADGPLVLGPGCRVARWVDCQERIRIGEGCAIGGRVSSGHAIRLEHGASAPSLYAAAIEALPLDCVDKSDVAGCERVSLPLQSALGPGEARRLGIEPRRLLRLSADCWIYRGALKPWLPLHVRTKLLVKGDCECPPGSFLEDDLKASGALRIGAGSRCRGNLLSTRDLWMGPGVRFEGVLHSGRTLRMSRGVRGWRRGGLVAAYATESLFIDQDVAIEGKLAAGRAVVAGAAGARLAAILLLAAVLLPGQRREAPKPAAAPVRLEFGLFGSHVDRNFGFWRGAELQLWIRSNARLIPAFFFETQTRPTGTQQNYAFLSLVNWSQSFYTVQGISAAPQHGPLAIYFPRLRLDAKAYWKVPPSRQWVLAAGWTAFDFGAPGRGQIFNLGSLYYRGKLVLEGNFFLNRNQPGNLFSASGGISGQYGREKSYWVGASVSGGRELYRYTGFAPLDLSFPSYSLQMFYRKWVSERAGVAVIFTYLDKLGAYRQIGTAAHLFFDF